MTKQRFMNELSNYCCWDDIKSLKSFLENNANNIDFDDPIVQPFGIVISYNHAEALQTLLDFYTETKLQHPKNSMQYKTAFVDLQNLLYDAQDGCWPSDRIREMLKPYLTEVIDTTSERDEIMEEDRVWPEHEEATTEERNSGDSVRNDEIETMPLTMINLYLKDHSDEFPKAETIDSKLIGDTT